MKLTSIIIKIILLLILTAAVFIGVRLFSGDQKFAAVLDDWLDQFQEQVYEDNDDDDSDQEENDSDEDDDDDDDVPSRVEIYEGLPAVRLDEEVVSRSGIKVSPLQQSTNLDEARITGQVIDFQSLLNKRIETDKAKSDLQLAQASYNASSKVYERLRVLHKERANVSLRQVEEARFQLSESKAKTVAAEQQIKNIRAQTLQTWGSVLTESTLGIDEDSIFDRLLQNQDVLILMTLPSDLPLSKKSQFIYINSEPDRVTAQKAFLISPASYTNSVTPGITYYFRTAAENLRINMRLTGWISLSDQMETGINIPLSAVIWYGGQPWVYVKVTNELYSRRPVSNYRETDSGWFISNTFDPNEMIVSEGGQLLLSEELRWQIPDEDDD